ncbi:N-acetyltransferase [Chryseobacterium nematophagum]|uniref:N-acetyltransferase n=1 Tax=Chryseobacterium nematophagum TaxID=2305228 RepID=A0A3M7L7G3_9FLAO|nr:GNAT family N-acetyltransferase [Chryseobacterium nematophagum]RMZ58129.1 N-acetyltransferase [Chryseobacterium nematophagum]
MEDVIILRKLSVDDTEVLSTLANNRNIWNNMRDIFPHPYTIDDAKNFIAMVSKEDVQLTFGIDFNDQLVGVISFIRQPDVYRKSVEIGFWVGEEYWKKGIAKASVKKMIDYAVKNLDVNRIFANVFEYNTASMKVLKDNDFKEEGISINMVYKNNQFYNLHRFYLLINNG